MDDKCKNCGMIKKLTNGYCEDCTCYKCGVPLTTIDNGLCSDCEDQIDYGDNYN